ncbi:MAG: hypothetical protein HY592_04750, partial [Candidatus Omnitrophica bacterium]|nr:hypothetical protein [Candidatus Omnitrophota bacterium]
GPVQANDIQRLEKVLDRYAIKGIDASGFLLERNPGERWVVLDRLERTAITPEQVKAFQAVFNGGARRSMNDVEILFYLVEMSGQAASKGPVVITGEFEKAESLGPIRQKIREIFSVSSDRMVFAGKINGATTELLFVADGRVRQSRVESADKSVTLTRIYGVRGEVKAYQADFAAGASFSLSAADIERLKAQKEKTYVKAYALIQRAIASDDIKTLATGISAISLRTASESTGPAARKAGFILAADRLDTYSRAAMREFLAGPDHLNNAGKYLTLASPYEKVLAGFEDYLKVKRTSQKADHETGTALADFEKGYRLLSVKSQIVRSNASKAADMIDRSAPILRVAAIGADLAALKPSLGNGRLAVLYKEGLAQAMSSYRAAKLALQSGDQTAVFKHYQAAGQNIRVLSIATGLFGAIEKMAGDKNAGFLGASGRAALSRARASLGRALQAITSDNAPAAEKHLKSTEGYYQKAGNIQQANYNAWRRAEMAKAKATAATANPTAVEEITSKKPTDQNIRVERQRDGTTLITGTKTWKDAKTGVVVTQTVWQVEQAGRGIVKDKTLTMISGVYWERRDMDWTTPQGAYNSKVVVRQKRGNFESVSEYGASGGRLNLGQVRRSTVAVYDDKGKKQFTAKYDQNGRLANMAAVQAGPFILNGRRVLGVRSENGKVILAFDKKTTLAYQVNGSNIILKTQGPALSLSMTAGGSFVLEQDIQSVSAKNSTAGFTLEKGAFLSGDLRVIVQGVLAMTGGARLEVTKGIASHSPPSHPGQSESKRVELERTATGRLYLLNGRIEIQDNSAIMTPNQIVFVRGGKPLTLTLLVGIKNKKSVVLKVGENIWSNEVRAVRQNDGRFNIVTAESYGFRDPKEISKIRMIVELGNAGAIENPELIVSDRSKLLPFLREVVAEANRMANGAPAGVSKEVLRSDAGAFQKLLANYTVTEMSLFDFMALASKLHFGYSTRSYSAGTGGAAVSHQMDQTFAQAIARRLGIREGSAFDAEIQDRDFAALYNNYVSAASAGKLDAMNEASSKLQTMRLAKSKEQMTPDPGSRMRAANIYQAMLANPDYHNRISKEVGDEQAFVAQQHRLLQNDWVYAFESALVGKPLYQATDLDRFWGGIKLFAGVTATVLSFGATAVAAEGMALTTSQMISNIAVGSARLGMAAAGVKMVVYTGSQGYERWQYVSSGGTEPFAWKGFAGGLLGSAASGAGAGFGYGLLMGSAGELASRWNNLRTIVGLPGGYMIYVPGQTIQNAIIGGFAFGTANMARGYLISGLEGREYDLSQAGADFGIGFIAGIPLGAFMGRLSAVNAIGRGLGPAVTAINNLPAAERMALFGIGGGAISLGRDWNVISEAVQNLPPADQQRLRVEYGVISFLNGALIGLILSSATSVSGLTQLKQAGGRLGHFTSNREVLYRDVRIFGRTILREKVISGPMAGLRAHALRGAVEWIPVSAIFTVAGKLWHVIARTVASILTNGDAVKTAQNEWQKQFGPHFWREFWTSVITGPEHGFFLKPMIFIFSPMAAQGVMVEQSALLAAGRWTWGNVQMAGFVTGVNEGLSLISNFSLNEETGLPQPIRPVGFSFQFNEILSWTILFRTGANKPMNHLAGEFTREYKRTIMPEKSESGIRGLVQRISVEWRAFRFNHILRSSASREELLSMAQTRFGIVGIRVANILGYKTSNQIEREIKELGNQQDARDRLHAVNDGIIAREVLLEKAQREGTAYEGPEFEAAVAAETANVTASRIKWQAAEASRARARQTAEGEIKTRPDFIEDVLAAKMTAYQTSGDRLDEGTARTQVLGMAKWREVVLEREKQIISEQQADNSYASVYEGIERGAQTYVSRTPVNFQFQGLEITENVVRIARKFEVAYASLYLRSGFSWADEDARYIVGVSGNSSITLRHGELRDIRFSRAELVEAAADRVVEINPNLRSLNPDLIRAGHRREGGQTVRNLSGGIKGAEEALAMLFAADGWTASFREGFEKALLQRMGVSRGFRRSMARAIEGQAGRMAVGYVGRALASGLSLDAAAGLLKTILFLEDRGLIKISTPTGMEGREGEAYSHMKEGLMRIMAERLNEMAGNGPITAETPAEILMESYHNYLAAKQQAENTNIDVQREIQIYEAVDMALGGSVTTRLGLMRENHPAEVHPASQYFERLLSGVLEKASTALQSNVLEWARLQAVALRLSPENRVGQVLMTVIETAKGDTEVLRSFIEALPESIYDSARITENGMERSQHATLRSQALNLLSRLDSMGQNERALLGVGASPEAATRLFLNPEFAREAASLGNGILDRDTFQAGFKRAMDDLWKSARAESVRLLRKDIAGTRVKASGQKLGIAGEALQFSEEITVGLGKIQTDQGDLSVRAKASLNLAQIHSRQFGSGGRMFSSGVVREAVHAEAIQVVLGREYAQMARLARGSRIPILDSLNLNRVKAWAEKRLKEVKAKDEDLNFPRLVLSRQTGAVGPDVSRLMDRVGLQRTTAEAREEAVKELERLRDLEVTDRTRVRQDARLKGVFNAYFINTYSSEEERSKQRARYFLQALTRHDTDQDPFFLEPAARNMDLLSFLIRNFGKEMRITVARVLTGRDLSVRIPKTGEQLAIIELLVQIIRSGNYDSLGVIKDKVDVLIQNSEADLGENWVKSNLTNWDSLRIGSIDLMRTLENANKELFLKHLEVLENDLKSKLANFEFLATSPKSKWFEEMGWTGETQTTVRNTYLEYQQAIKDGNAALAEQKGKEFFALLRSKNNKNSLETFAKGKGLLGPDGDKAVNEADRNEELLALYRSIFGMSEKGLAADYEQNKDVADQFGARLQARMDGITQDISAANDKLDAIRQMVDQDRQAAFGRNGAINILDALAYARVTFRHSFEKGGKTDPNVYDLRPDQTMMLYGLLQGDNVALETGGGKTNVNILYFNIMRLVSGNAFRGKLLLEDKNAVANYIGNKGDEQRTIGNINRALGLRLFDGVTDFIANRGDRRAAIEAHHDANTLVVVDYITNVHLWNEAEVGAQRGDYLLLAALRGTRHIVLDEFHKFLTSTQYGIIAENVRSVGFDEVMQMESIVRSLADADTTNGYRLRYEEGRTLHRVRTIDAYNRWHAHYAETAHEKEAAIIYNEKTKKVWLTQELERQMEKQGFNTEAVEAAIQGLLAVKGHDYSTYLEGLDKARSDQPAEIRIVPVGTAGKETESSFQRRNYAITLALREAGGDLAMAQRIATTSDTSMANAIRKSISVPGAEVVATAATLLGLEGPAAYQQGRRAINISGSVLNGAKLSRTNIVVHDAEEVNNEAINFAKDRTNKEETVFIAISAETPGLMEKYRTNLSSQSDKKIGVIDANTTDAELRNIIDHPGEYSVVLMTERGWTGRNYAQLEKTFKVSAHLIVVDAHRIGASDLVQLLGRVGRNNTEATADRLILYNSNELTSNLDQLRQSRVGHDFRLKLLQRFADNPEVMKEVLGLLNRYLEAESKPPLSNEELLTLNAHFIEINQDISGGARHSISDNARNQIDISFAKRMIERTHGTLKGRFALVQDKFLKTESDYADLTLRGLDLKDGSEYAIGTIHHAVKELREQLEGVYSWRKSGESWWMGFANWRNWLPALNPFYLYRSSSSNFLRLGVYNSWKILGEIQKARETLSQWEERLYEGNVDKLKAEAELDFMENGGKVRSLGRMTGKESLDKVIDTLVKASLSLAQRDVLYSSENTGVFKGELRNVTATMVVEPRPGQSPEEVKPFQTVTFDRMSRTGDEYQMVIRRRIPNMGIGWQLLVVPSGASGMPTIQLFNPKDTEADVISLRFDERDTRAAAFFAGMGSVGKIEVSGDGKKMTLSSRSVQRDLHEGTTLMEMTGKLGLGTGAGAMRNVTAMLGLPEGRLYSPNTRLKEVAELLGISDSEAILRVSQAAALFHRIVRTPDDNLNFIATTAEQRESIARVSAGIFGMSPVGMHQYPGLGRMQELIYALRLASPDDKTRGFTFDELRERGLISEGTYQNLTFLRNKHNVNWRRQLIDAMNESFRFVRAAQRMNQLSDEERRIMKAPRNAREQAIRRKLLLRQEAMGDKIAIFVGNRLVEMFSTQSDRQEALDYLSQRQKSSDDNPIPPTVSTAPLLSGAPFLRQAQETLTKRPSTLMRTGIADGMTAAIWNGIPVRQKIGSLIGRPFQSFIMFGLEKIARRGILAKMVMFAEKKISAWEFKEADYAWRPYTAENVAAHRAYARVDRKFNRSPGGRRMSSLVHQAVISARESNLNPLTLDGLEAEGLKKIIEDLIARQKNQNSLDADQILDQVASHLSPRLGDRFRTEAIEAQGPVTVLTNALKAAGFDHGQDTEAAHIVRTKLTLEELDGLGEILKRKNFLRTIPQLERALAENGLKKSDHLILALLILGFIADGQFKALQERIGERALSAKDPMVAMARMGDHLRAFMTDMSLVDPKAGLGITPSEWIGFATNGYPSFDVAADPVNIIQEAQKASDFETELENLLARAAIQNPTNKTLRAWVYEKLASQASQNDPETAVGYLRRALASAAGVDKEFSQTISKKLSGQLINLADKQTDLAAKVLTLEEALEFSRTKTNEQLSSQIRNTYSKLAQEAQNDVNSTAENSIKRYQAIIRRYNYLALAARYGANVTELQLSAAQDQAEAATRDLGYEVEQLRLGQSGYSAEGERVYDGRPRIIGALSLILPLIVEIPGFEKRHPGLTKLFASIFDEYSMPSIDAVYSGPLSEEGVRKRAADIFYNLYRDALTEDTLDKTLEDFHGLRSFEVQPTEDMKHYKAVIMAAWPSHLYFFESGLAAIEALHVQHRRSNLQAVRLALSDADHGVLTVAEKNVKEVIQELKSELLGKARGETAEQLEKHLYSDEDVVAHIASGIAQNIAQGSMRNNKAEIKKKILEDVRNYFLMLEKDGLADNFVIDLDKSDDRAGSDEFKAFKALADYALGHGITINRRKIRVQYMKRSAVKGIEKFQSVDGAYMEGVGILIIPVDDKTLKPAKLPPSLLIHEMLHAVSKDFANHDIREGLVTRFAAKIAESMGDSHALDQEGYYERAQRMIARWERAWTEAGQSSENIDKTLFAALYEGSFDALGLYGIQELTARLERASVKTVLIDGQTVSLSDVKARFQNEDFDDGEVEPVLVSVARQGSDYVLVPTPGDTALDTRVRALAKNSPDVRREAEQAKIFISKVLMHYVEAYRKGEASAGMERLVLAEAYKINPELGYWTEELLSLKDREDEDSEGQITSALDSLNVRYLEPLGLQANAEIEGDTGIFFLNGFAIVKTIKDWVGGRYVPLYVVADLDFTEHRSRNNAVHRPRSMSIFRNTVVEWIFNEFSAISSGEKTQLISRLREDLDRLRAGGNTAIFTLSPSGYLELKDPYAALQEYPHVSRFVQDFNREVWKDPIYTGARRVENPELLNGDEALRLALLRRFTKVLNHMMKEDRAQSLIFGKSSATGPKQTIIDLLRKVYEIDLKVHEFRHELDKLAVINGISRSTLFKNQAEVEIPAHLEEWTHPSMRNSLAAVAMKLYAQSKYGTAGVAYQRVGAKIFSGLVGTSYSKLMDADQAEFLKTLERLALLSEEEIIRRAKKMQDNFDSKFGQPDPMSRPSSISVEDFIAYMQSQMGGPGMPAGSGSGSPPPPDKKEPVPSASRLAVDLPFVTPVAGLWAQNSAPSLAVAPPAGQTDPAMYLAALGGQFFGISDKEEADEFGQRLAQAIEEPANLELLAADTPPAEFIAQFLPEGVRPVVDSTALSDFAGAIQDYLYFQGMKVIISQGASSRRLAALDAALLNIYPAEALKTLEPLAPSLGKSFVVVVREETVMDPALQEGLVSLGIRLVTTANLSAENLPVDMTHLGDELGVSAAEKALQEDVRGTTGVIAPNYYGTHMAVYLAVTLHTVASRNERRAVVVADRDNVPAHLAGFMSRHRDAIHPIYKFWNYLKEIFQSVQAVRLSA